MSVQNLETQYLKAKIAYYEGNPIMSDAAFDLIEHELKAAGSKVIEQVGSKRKDFDFPHPTPMRSLAKIQTDKTDNQKVAFETWYNKRSFKISQHYGGSVPFLFYAPKFDGNAINIIYKDSKLVSVLTRGDGQTGKDITDRFKKYLPDIIHLPTTENTSITEIRCEVVIKMSIFNKKYAKDFANARNFVAGVLGKDDYSFEKVADLTIIPLVFLMNGKYQPLSHLDRIDVFKDTYLERARFTDYSSIICKMDALRQAFEFQLDGVVFSFPIEYRDFLGENDHDPEWAIAIKFVPDEVFSKYLNTEWNVGKTGELTPVVIMEPVQLAGTTVKRASGYNAGYIVNNHIGPGATFSVAKAGDIIPEIQEIIIPSTNNIKLPEFCPACSTALTFDGIHLMCNNPYCFGKISKKLASAATSIDLKGIGGKTLEPFARDFKNMYELIRYVYAFGHHKSIEQYGIIYGSRSHEIFVRAFTNIKSLTYEQVIVMLGYDNVGRKLSLQIAKEHCGLTPDYSGHDRTLVALLHQPNVENYIKGAVSGLESLGITIDKPNAIAISNNSIFICMTGSPKNFGFKTKDEFANQFADIVEVDISDKRCQYLITDDYASTSTKMKAAVKKGITIKRYDEFNVGKKQVISKPVIITPAPMPKPISHKLF